MKASLEAFKPLASIQESGNGGGYEGKPDGVFYHYSPSFTCEGKPSAEQITEIRNGQAFLYVSENNQCANQSAPIPVDDIHISPFQNEFITVKDSLFKRYDEKPAGIPNNLAEVLCRDNFENPTFEIVSHYDRELNQAMTRIYKAGQQISDFSVSRILSSSEVRYVAGNISFKVDLSKPAFAERKFAGQIEKTSVASLAAQSLTCVIGGSIDTSKWNLKALTDGKQDTGGFQLMKNNEILFFSEVSRHYFSPTIFSYVTHLFKIGHDSVISDFSQAVFGEKYDIKYRNGNVGNDVYLFSGKLTSEMWTSLLLYDARTGKSKRLTNIYPGADPETHNTNSPVLTEGQYLFYDTNIWREFNEYMMVVRVYNFNDDSITEIATLGSNVRNGYSVLPKSNKLLIFWAEKDGIRNVLEIYDAKSKTAKHVPMQTSGNCSIVGFDVKNTSDEKSVLATQVCEDKSRNVVQVFLADGAVNVLGLNSAISWMSEDLNRILLTETSNSTAAYDLRTGKANKLPIQPGFGDGNFRVGFTDLELLSESSKIALANDRYLYGFGGNTDSPTMYQVDLNTGISAPICETAIGKKLFVGQLANQKVFLFTYDSALKVYRFYQAKSPTDCARLNEFPSAYPNVRKLMPTQIGFGLLLGNPLTRYADDTAVEAVFAPIDGRPP
ncbi:MAG: hypothetical protein ACXWC9_07630, partial [Pseudobdellovibrionaceae bacterium]